MSALDRLIAYLCSRPDTAHMDAHHAEFAESVLAEHRAQVRREVLGDDLNPSSLVLDAQAYRWLADDIIATMDDPDRWGADETEQVILSRYVKWLADGKPPRDDEPAPDFFQPGRTYAHARYRFECLHLVTHPVSSEVQAWGWFGKADTDGRRHISFGRGQWDARPWDDITTGGGR